MREAQIGTEAREGACALARTAAKVDAGAAQVFFRLVARGVRPGDRLRIEWLDPSGRVSTYAEYDEMPRASELCFLSALPVGGFAPSTQPGLWRVRVSLNGAAVHEQSFELEGSASGLTARVTEVNESSLAIDTTGFVSETTINIAHYTPAGGWAYIATALADRQSGSRVWVQAPKLEPGEYLVILRNPDGAQSLPARFVISAGGGYRMPALDGERWRVSQGPYGSYSHWGRAVHAYDLAPVDARWVAAMRGGIAHVYDLGLGQTPGRRIFGNYLTIDHGDGEYSHYAHLRTRTFQVRTGQRVEAGDILSEVGNSGYSFGRHVLVHVTRAPSVSAQSVPFRFEERSGVISSALRPAQTAAKASKPALRWQGEAAFAQWWTRLLSVPSGARSLAVKLGWEDRSNEFDLYLVSPSGRTYRPEGPEGALRVPQPEAGQWRVSVQAVRSGGESSVFWVEPEVTPARQ
ncbi:MAG: M23 family metallopeptidase [Acidobacteria bacterium]|nr:M23 family metallopeptidase [Acidobacteriota bacterium]